MFPKVLNRIFQVWSYTVGHGQLLLRSTKTEECSTRIDVGFKNVVYVQLPMLININEIYLGSLVDLPEDVRRLIDLKDKSVYVIDIDGAKGVVAAGYGAWHEDEGEYNQPSTVLPILP